MRTFLRGGDRFLVVAAGEWPRPAMVRRLAAAADRVLACDGAADRLRRLGVMPDAIVGDMDSLAGGSWPRTVRRVRVAEQETTDLEKVLRVAGLPRRDRVVWFCGLTGGRSDFTLYNLHLLGRWAGLRVAAVERSFFVFPVSGTFGLERVRPRCRVSFLPLERIRVRRAEGFVYPFSGRVLVPGRFESVSNGTTDGSLALETEGKGLLFLAHEALSGALPWET